MATVDVVVPCYNYARYLRRCIGSALSQEGVDVRVLIIDDTSKDETPVVGAQLQAEDSRVRFTRHEVNRGHIATYNEGLLDWASADYSVLLSADDLLAPGALLRATKVMDAHPDVTMTYGMAILFTNDEELPAEAPRSESGSEYQVVPRDVFLKRSIVGNPVPTPAAIVRTRVQQEVGGYSKALPHSGDMEMWMRFAQRGSIGVVPEVLAYKRIHATNMQLAYNNVAVGDLRERVAACRAAFAFGTEADAQKWNAVTNEIMGEQAFWLASAKFEKGQDDLGEQCLAYALELNPQLRETGSWRKLSIKRQMPKPALRGLQALSGLFNNTTDAPPARQASRIGWWPSAEEGPFLHARKL
jgi:GT2 family glycosyltransferase